MLKSASCAALFALFLAACSKPLALDPVLPSDPETMDVMTRELVEKRIAAVQAAPSSANAHLDLALAYHANDLWLESEQSWQRVIELGLEPSLARRYRADALAEMQLFDEVLPLLERASKERPKDPATAYRLAVEYLESGRFDEAREYFRKATDLLPRMPHGYIGLGEVALQEDQPKIAVTHLRHALKLDAKNLQAHFFLGTALSQLGNEKEATPHLAFGDESARRWLGDEWTTRFSASAVSLSRQITKANALLEEGKTGAAKSILEELFSKEPTHRPLRNNLAAAYSSNRNWAKAIELLEGLIQEQDNDYRAWAHLAKCYSFGGEHAKALHAADRAIGLAPDAYVGHFERARALTLMKDHESALDSLRRATRVEPNHAESHFALGEIQSLLNDHPGAAKSFQRTVDLDRTKLDAHYKLCIQWIRLQEPDKARRAMEAFREVVPNDPRIRELVIAYQRQFNQ